MKVTTLLLLSVAIGLLGTIASCARLVEPDEPNTATGTTVEYPDIHAAIEESVNKVMSVLDAAAGAHI